GSGGCGDDEPGPGDDEDGDEDEEDEDDSSRAICRPRKPSTVTLNCLTETMWVRRSRPGRYPIRAFPFDVSRATCRPGNLSPATSRPGFPRIVAGKNDEPVAAGRWLPVEEELLATCYVAVSEDNNVGRSQKHETFWYRVLNEFNSKNFQKRTKDMLTSKWHTLNTNCQKFNVAYKRAKRLGKSGENDVDVMKQAQSIYRDKHKGVAFCQEDAWAILKFHSKWDAPEQVDLTGDVPGATQEDLFGHDARARPAGKPRPPRKPNPTPR
nr:hypothetical protein [Tanacetum cinerariifolium]